MSDASLNISDLLDDAELVAFVVYELSAARPSDGTGMTSAEEPASVSPEMRIGYDRNSENTGFRVRVVVEMQVLEGRVVADGALEYLTSNNACPDYADEVIGEFTRDVGFLAAFPYIRECISEITRRVFGEPITLPVVKRSQLTFD